MKRLLFIGLIIVAIYVIRHRSPEPTTETASTPAEVSSQKDESVSLPPESPAQSPLSATPAPLFPAGATLEQKKAIIAQRMQEARLASRTAPRPMSSTPDPQQEAAREAQIAAEIGPAPKMGGVVGSEPPWLIKEELERVTKQAAAIKYNEASMPFVATYHGRRCWAVTFSYRGLNKAGGYAMGSGTGYIAKDKLLGLDHHRPQ